MTNIDNAYSAPRWLQIAKEQLSTCADCHGYTAITAPSDV